MHDNLSLLFSTRIYGPRFVVVFEALNWLHTKSERQTVNKSIIHKLHRQCGQSLEGKCFYFYQKIFWFYKYWSNDFPSSDLCGGMKWNGVNFFFSVWMAWTSESVYLLNLNGWINQCHWQIASSLFFAS